MSTSNFKLNEINLHVIMITNNDRNLNATTKDQHYLPESVKVVQLFNLIMHKLNTKEFQNSHGVASSFLLSSSVFHKWESATVLTDGVAHLRENTW